MIGGYSNPTMGRQATNPQFQNPTSFNPKFNYSMVHGRHSLKAGYEFLAIRTEVLDINPLYGMLTYAGGFSKPTAAQCGCTPGTDTTSFNLADFYFGLPSAIAQGSNLTTNLRQHVHSLYVQDDCRANSKLTLNIGMRWEYATPLWERDNLWSNFDPATNALVRATSGSLFNRALVNPDYKDLRPAPRYGLQRRFEDVHPRRLRDQLLVLQSSRQRHRRHQRTACHLRRDQPVIHGGRPRAFHLPHDADGFHHRDREHVQSDPLEQRLHPGKHALAV